MQMLAIGMHKKLNSRGFTLVEILVVVVIISVTATFVVLRMNTQYIGGRQAQDVARQLKMIIEVAQEQAILQGTQLGLVHASDAYGFVQYESGTDEREAHWRSLPQDKLLGYRDIPPHVVMEITIKNKTVPPSRSPAIFLYPSGEMTPFVIKIGAEDTFLPYRLIGKATGEIEFRDLLP